VTIAGGIEGRSVRLSELRVGELLAEGGEGRVYQLPLQPHLVFKAYRRPVPRSYLDELVAWPEQLRTTRFVGPELASRVEASSAWPVAVVEGDGSDATGLLLPRAPKRFSVRHRDGATRLASLSYLTADPAHRALAYGLQLPGEASPERFGLVYALARLIDAFETGAPRIGHGDLSTKNVLWSLQRGPEVFVIDCDNCERFGADERPMSHSTRRRATTPNWDDPAITGRDNPGLASDRYSLALIFLRVVGAANFPIQARQRGEGSVTVDFALPLGPYGEGLLGPAAPVWDLCERGLSLASPKGRPPASAWMAALEEVLDSLGASAVKGAVWSAQGGGRPSVPVAAQALGPKGGDVEIRPVLRPERSRPSWTKVSSRPLAFTSGLPPAIPTTFIAGPSRPGPASAAVANPSANPVLPQVLAAIGRAMTWWVDAHTRAVQLSAARGRRAEAVRSLAFCAVVDVGLAIATIFVAAMLVAPVIGI
jgi:hypothetical protein